MANKLDVLNPTMTSTPSIGQASQANSAAAPAAASSSVNHRLMKELCDLIQSTKDTGISAFPAGENITAWNATMNGPDDSPYESLKFTLALSFPTNYPIAPPEVLFKTPIYHPNIDMSGRICLDILKPGGDGKEGAWSPALSAMSVLLSIKSLLGDPNNSSPLNGEAALLWDRDQTEFKKKVLARHQVSLE